MELNNFLFNAYFNRFDNDFIQSYRDISADETTQKIISRFLDISKNDSDLPMDRPGNLSEQYLSKLKVTQIFGLNIPKKYGGVGLSLKQYLSVVEAITVSNMALGLTALAHLSIGVKGIVLFGSKEQKQKYLPPAAAGKMIFAFALTEPGTGSDARHIETTATLSEDGRHYLLNGQKTYITNANFAGAMTVFAQTDPENHDKMGAFIVETSWKGVKIGKEMPKMGIEESSTAPVRFNNVAVPKENMLGRPGDGFKMAMTILNYGRLALGAASFGMMKQSEKDMLKRASNRIQFGVPIRKFQLIQEKMVKARLNHRVASAMTSFVAGMLESDPLALAAVESSHCKLFGTTRAWETLYEALQVSGGAGYLSTLPYEKRMRDFRVTTIFEGTTEIHSIYPALYMLRQLTRQMQPKGKGNIQKALFILKRLWHAHPWKQRFEKKEMNHAVTVANRLSRRIRFLICFGVLLFGKKMLERQFLLRRISRLSVYYFAIVSLVARLNSARTPVPETSVDFDILSLLLDEAVQFKRSNQRLRSYPSETLHQKIFTHL